MFYALYDICEDGKPHRYNVPVELFDKNITKHISGEQAIQEHNKYKMTDYIINDKLVDRSIVDFVIYYHNDKMYSYVCVDFAKLDFYYAKHNKIPNEQLIIDAILNNHIYDSIENSSFGIVPKKNYDDETLEHIRNICNKVIIPVDDVYGSMIEHPKFIKENLRLYNYQKRTIKWMIETELERKKIYYSYKEKTDKVVGDYIISPADNKVTKRVMTEYIQFNGGALIDEVGLGKTIQMITLAMSNRLPLNKMSYIDPNYKMLKSKATLIICPNQLCGQWKREITNWIDNTSLKVVPLLTKVHFDNCTYKDILDADFVIVSFNFIGNRCFSQHYMGNIADKTITNNNIHIINENKKKLINESIQGGLAILNDTEPLIHIIHWHRIIIDEFHEINTVDKYKHILPFIKLLDGTYKWVVTGTPFDKSLYCFFEMIKFVSNKKTTGEVQKVLNQPEIHEYVSNLFFRRNTKKSVEEEFKLPELCEKNIWMKFTQSERMLYNSYKADHNVDRYSATLRQMCCHPKIIEDMAESLSKCKTLADVEKTMVSHYRIEYLKALNNVYKQKHSIARAERYVLKVYYGIQKRLLLAKKKPFDKIKYIISLPDLVLETHPLLEEYKLEREKCNSDKQNQIENLEEQEDNYVIQDNDDEQNDDNSDDEYEIYEINGSKEVQDDIKKKIGTNAYANIKQHDSYYNAIDYVKQKQTRHNEFISIAEGKKTSYEFYQNMLARISQITEKSKEKYMMMLNGEDDDSDYDDDDETDVCGICLNSITGNDVGVTKCGHFFCYECIKLTLGDKNSNHKCPTCMKSTTIKDVSVISFEKPKLTKDNYEQIQSKLEMINNIGTKLTNLVYYLSSIPDHVIIFSQWDSLLRMVGKVLEDHGIKNVYCKGNVWSRDKTIREFNTDESVRVIMLSSESAASGTNLTKASKVIFLDPISGDYEHRKNVAWQAIGRAYRLGQKNKVEIVNLLIKDTVEEEIYKENKENDAKYGVQMLISEISDDAIQLSDDKIQHIQTEINKTYERQKANPDTTKKVITKIKKDIKQIEYSDDDSDIDDIIDEY